MVIKANREFELELLKEYDVVAGIDEVGRGCLAGPVYVAIAVVDKKTEECSIELRDSKLLSEKSRKEKYSTICEWVADYAIGISSNDEIDTYGITKALSIAGHRAIDELKSRGVEPDIYILDGKHNWLNAQNDLFDIDEKPEIKVITKIKADASCSVVAAASIIAKVNRDEYMSSLGDTKYDFIHNKGYSSPKHILALKEYGICELHRKTWKMPV